MCTVHGQRHGHAGRRRRRALRSTGQQDEVKGHALMVHMGGDNHSDHPAPLGGGGARVACGVIDG